MLANLSSFGASKGWWHEDHFHSVQDTIYFDPIYIKANFLYQCKKNHFPDPALHSWGWNRDLPFCRHTKNQQVLAEIVAHLPCHYDLLWPRLYSTGTWKCPLQPHYSTRPGRQSMRLIHNWRQIHGLPDFKPYLSPITSGSTSLYLFIVLPMEDSKNQAHCFQTVGCWYLVELCQINKAWP